MARIYAYDIADGTVAEIADVRPGAVHRRARPGFITNDEESSGIIDTSRQFGRGYVPVRCSGPQEDRRSTGRAGPVDADPRQELESRVRRGLEARRLSPFGPARFRHPSDATGPAQRGPSCLLPGTPLAAGRRGLEVLERRVGLLDRPLGGGMAGRRLGRLVLRRPRLGPGQLVLDGGERRSRPARRRPRGAPARAPVLRRPRLGGRASAGAPTAIAFARGAPRPDFTTFARRRRGRRRPPPARLRSSRTRTYSAQPPT